MVIIPIYSEQDLTPRASEVIRAIVGDSYPDEVIKFTPWSSGDKRMLVFGKPPAGNLAGIQIVYTYSIAQIMSKANAASVLKAALTQFLAEPVVPPFRYPIFTTDAGAILATLDPSRPTAIDIETNGLLGKTHTPEEVQIISVAFYQEGNAPVVLVSGVELQDDKGKTITGSLITSQLATLATVLPLFEKGIYHNGKFDVRVLNRVLGVKLNVWFDTMLAHHVLNHAAGDHKLKPLARRYLGAPDWEGDLAAWTVGGGHYEYIPMNKLVEYNGWDVYWTYKLWEFLSPQIEADDNNVKAYTLEKQAAEFLLGVEIYGIPMDVAYAEDYGFVLEVEQLNHLNQLEKIVGRPVNPNSPKQVKELYEELGYPLKDTSVDTLEALDMDNDPQTQDITNKILAYRKAGKTRGTYAVGWSSRSRDGRVHPTYLVHGTSTGRLSSTGPNAQNVPRDKAIRKMVKTLGA